MGVRFVKTHLAVYFKLVHFILCRVCVNQLSLKIHMVKVVDVLSKGLDRENGSFPRPATPRGRETLPLVHKLLQTYQLLEIFENETLRKSLTF